MVEIGGGSGSAALAVAERLSRDAALPRIGRYVFTEVVPTFLRRAERTLRGRFPALPAEFLRLDMDRDFAEQGVPPGIADVVYAVNTVHIAKDLAATLARIRETLKPGRDGGLLRVRPPERRTADLRRVRLQFSRELHRRRDGRRRRGRTTAS